MRFPPEHLGGAEIAAYKLAKKLSDRGHQIHVFTTRINKVPELTDESGFTVHRLKTIEIPVLRTIIFSLRSLWEIKDLKIDIVHSQSISVYNAGLPALIIKKILGLPYIAWGRGSDIFLSKGCERFFNKIILKTADSIIVLTQAMGDKLTTLVSIPYEVIPNGCDTEQFKNLNKDICRKKLNIETNEKIILFVGRLHPVKGIEYLVDAMVHIQKRYKNTKLLIIGNGEQKRELEKRVNNYKLNDFVQFIGELPHSQLPDFFVASDFFVLPSISEGFPNVLLEAMAAGLPVIGTKIPGIPEIINNSRNGILVEPKDSLAIARAIQYLIDHPVEQTVISKNNLDDVKKFEWKSILPVIEQIYIRVIKKSQGTR